MVFLLDVAFSTCLFKPGGQMKIVVDKELYATIRKFSAKICRKHPQLTEDVAQETAAAVHGLNVENVNTYIYNTAKNFFLKALQKGNAVNKCKEALMAEPFYNDANPYRETAGTLAQRKVRAYMSSKMTNTHKSILTYLMDNEGANHVDMQAHLGAKNYNSAKSNYRQMLKSHGANLKKIITE